VQGRPSMSGITHELAQGYGGLILTPQTMCLRAAKLYLGMHAYLAEISCFFPFDSKYGPG